MTTQLPEELLALAKKLGADGARSFRVDSKVVHLDPYTSSKGALLGARLRVSLGKEIAPSAILFRHEGTLDRAGKGIGVNREFQTGDDAFDRDVYIETDVQDEDVRRILSEARVRDPIRELASEKIESLVLGGAGFVEGTTLPAAACLHVTFPTKAFGDVDALKRIAATLVRLAQELDRVDHSGPYRGDPVTTDALPPRKARIGRGLFLAFLCLAASLTGWYGVGFGGTPPTFGWKAFGIGAIGGAIAWVVLVVAAGVLLRGRSTSFRFMMFFAIGALPTILVGGRVAEHVNASSDRSTPHAERAIAALHSRSKGGPVADVTLEATNQSARIDGALRYAVAFSYTPLAVEATIADGALGSPWVVSLRPR